jgi:hypothetical protein
LSLFDTLSGLAHELSSHLFYLFLHALGDFLKNILVGEYLDFLLVEVVLDLKVRIAKIVLDHSQIEIFKPASFYLLF